MARRSVTDLELARSNCGLISLWRRPRRVQAGRTCTLRSTRAPDDFAVFLALGLPTGKFLTKYHRPSSTRVVYRDGSSEDTGFTHAPISLSGSFASCCAARYASMMGA